MAKVRILVVFALVALSSALAGCSFPDFYNQNGDVRVELAPQGPTNTSLSDFRKITIAVYGVSVRQIGSIDPFEFSFGDSPLVVDLVETGMRGDRVPLSEHKQSIRAVGEVTLRLDVVQAVDARGETMPVCREEDTVATFPCFFLNRAGAYRLTEPDFAPPRGGDVVMGFPLSVHEATVEGKTEYFLIADPTKVTLDMRRWG